MFCHSGSTAAYRTSIFHDSAFQRLFPNESWRGRQLNSGDDQFLTRWLVNHDWDVTLVNDGPGRKVETKMRADWRHILQLLRWCRNDWRACLSTLLWERHIWK
jgi:hypothetical protein